MSTKISNSENVRSAHDSKTKKPTWFPEYTYFMCSSEDIQATRKKVIEEIVSAEPKPKSNTHVAPPSVHASPVVILWVAIPLFLLAGVFIFCNFC